MRRPVIADRPLDSNSNIEIPNPEQFRITKYQMTEAGTRICLEHSAI